MAKDKTKTGVPNRHLHARISFLQQAATYLTLQRQVQKQQPESVSKAKSTETTSDEALARMDYKQPGDALATTLNPPSAWGLPLHLCNHLRQVAQKSQIRLHANIKRAICRRCNTALVDGQTCRRSIENLSRGGRKLHADVLVIECTVCGACKRFPVGATRQRRKEERQALPHGDEREGGGAPSGG